MTADRRASQRDSLADVRGSQAKADYRAQVSASALPELAEVAIKKAHGKALTAASVLGLSESHLGRLINDGDLKLKQLEALGPDTLVTFGKQLVERFGPLAQSPEQHTESLIDRIQADLNEVRQFVRGAK